MLQNGALHRCTRCEAKYQGGGAKVSTKERIFHYLGETDSCDLTSVAGLVIGSTHPPNMPGYDNLFHQPGQVLGTTSAVPSVRTKMITISLPERSNRLVSAKFAQLIPLGIPGFCCNQRVCHKKC